MTCKHVQMELDTGAAYSVIPEGVFKDLWPDGELGKFEMKLKSYSGEPIPVLGSREVHVCLAGIG